MSAMCQFSKCIRRSVYHADVVCSACPKDNRMHEETLCERHMREVVRGAQCSICRTTISVTSYRKLTEANSQEPPNPPKVVEQRITDADRNRAIELLGEAFAVGKLTKDEFDLRADRASVAKVQSALDSELSDVKPAERMQVERQQRNNLVRANVLMGVLLAICVIAAMVAILV